MSIILEALKKSENQRQRQTGPGFATVPERAERTARSLWPLLIVVLLAINTVVLAFFLLRGGDAPTSMGAVTPAGPRGDASAVPASREDTLQRQPPGTTPDRSAAAAQPGTRSAAPVKVARDVTPARNIRSLEREAATRTQPASEPSTPRTAAPTVTADDPPVTVAPARTSRPSTSVDGLPSATELYLKGELTGPSLNLDLHVYYPDPSRRVVFVNGRKYREGERLSSGPLVREIVPEGVILNNGARNFLLQAE